MLTEEEKGIIHYWKNQALEDFKIPLSPELRAFILKIKKGDYDKLLT